jgi:hypothetical protein
MITEFRNSPMFGEYETQEGNMVCYRPPDSLCWYPVVHVAGPDGYYLYDYEKTVQVSHSWGPQISSAMRRTLGVPAPVSSFTFGILTREENA